MQDRHRYRAWHKTKKKMFQVAEIDFKSSTISRLVAGLGMLNVYDLNEVDLLQCTGLKDKNGVLIYEGDIVNLGVPNSRNRAIEYDYESCGCCHTVYGWATEDYYVSLKNKNIQIIGNKYEHPELLKDKADE